MRGRKQGILLSKISNIIYNMNKELELILKEIDSLKERVRSILTNQPQTNLPEAPKDIIEGELFFDGGTTENGKSSSIGTWGYVLIVGKKTIKNGGRIAGYGTTSNEAEYHGLIYGLEAARSHGIRLLNVYGDSKLVINQMKGLWRTKAPNLKKLNRQSFLIKSRFSKVKFTWIPREENHLADEMARIKL